MTEKYKLFWAPTTQALDQAVNDYLEYNNVKVKMSQFTTGKIVKKGRPDGVAYIERVWFEVVE